MELWSCAKQEAVKLFNTWRTLGALHRTEICIPHSTSRPDPLKSDLRRLVRCTIGGSNTRAAGSSSLVPPPLVNPHMVQGILSSNGLPPFYPANMLRTRRNRLLAALVNFQLLRAEEEALVPAWNVVFGHDMPCKSRLALLR